MKLWKSVLSMVLCLAMLLSVCMMFTSCDQKEKGPSFDAGTREEKIQAEANNRLQVLFSGVDPEDMSVPVPKAIKRFEDEYHHKVEFITCGYDEWNQKVMASIASGSPIDVINAGNYEFPLFAMKKYAQPIDELVDVTLPCMDLPVMERFKYQGKYYVVSSAGAAVPLMIYYNKDMFENEGVEDPLELYKEDKWTTDKLREIAMKFTRDTNGDGALDQWGMTAWYNWVFFGSSAASVCKINDQGLFELNMDNNPNLVEALEFIRSARVTDHWIGTEGSSIYTSFYQQKNAMLNEFTWAGVQILQAKDRGEFAFDVGAAPFPYGKCNKERVNYCFLGGIAISNGCACPYSAGRLLELMADEQAKDTAAKEAYVPKEWVELYKELGTRPFNSSMLDNAVDSGKALCGKVSDGMDVQQAIEAYKPVYQAMVDEANKIPEDKVEHDFKTIELDFSDGSMDGVMKASDAESLQLSNEGHGLHVAMDTLKYGEFCPAVKTDEKKFPLWGYKSYKVTFEYQVKEIPGEISAYLFELKRDGISGSFTDFVPSYDAIGSWQKAEVTLSGVNDNQPLSLVISGRYANDIFFKNLKIEEIKH